MKKKIIVLFMVLSCILSACGSKNIDKMTDQELYDYMSTLSEEEFNKWSESLTEEQQQRVWGVRLTYGFADLLSGDENEAKEETIDSEVEIENESSEKIYDKHLDWDKIPSTSGVQVGDVLFYEGEKVSNVIASLEVSDMDWEYIYNPDADVYRTGDELYLYVDGKEFVEIEITSYEEGPCKKSDANVTFINYTEDAEPYVRVFGGKSLSEIESLTLEDLEDVQNVLFSDISTLEVETKQSDYYITYVVHAEYLIMPESENLSEISANGYDYNKYYNITYYYNQEKVYYTYQALSSRHM